MVVHTHTYYCSPFLSFPPLLSPSLPLPPLALSLPSRLRFRRGLVNSMWDQFDDHKTVIKTVITHINHTVTDAGSTAVEEGGNAVDHTVGTQTAVVGGGPISTTFYNFTALRGNTSTKW